MINVVAIVRAKPAEAARVRAAVEALVAPTHAETTNRGYKLHVDLDDPACLVLYEGWESREALDAHLQTPHLQAFVAQHGDALAAPLELHILDHIAG